MKEELKDLRWNALLASALYIVLGLVCILIPDQMLLTLSRIIGWTLIVAGAVSVIAYLMRDVTANYFRNDFLHGIIAVAVGIVVLMKAQLLIDLIPVLFGVMVIISGCLKLQTAIDLQRMKIGSWTFELVMALAVLIFGIILVINPFRAMTTLLKLLGVGLIIGGVTDLISTLHFSRKVDNAVKTSFHEISSEKTEEPSEEPLKKQEEQTDKQQQ